MSRHLAFRALLVCLVALAAFAGIAALRPSVAFAAAKKSIAVGLIEGPQGDTTRKRVLSTLKKTDDYEITDAEDLKPGSDKGAYAAMAQALQVDAIVVGKVSRSYDLTLSVIGPDGNLIEDVKLKGGSAGELNNAIDNELEIAIAGPLGAKKAAATKPKVEEEEEEEDLPGAKAGGESEDEEDEGPAKEEPPPPEPKKVGLRPLEFLVGARLYNRAFVYKDLSYWPPGPNGKLQDYKLAIAPAIIVGLRIYPLAYMRDDWLSNIGITGKLEFGIATSTKYEQPQPTGPAKVFPLNNGTSEWQIGLRGRLPIGTHELGMFGMYGAHAFILAGDEGGAGKPQPLVPDTNYQYLRFGIDGRLHVSKLTVGAHFAPRFLTTMHQIDQTYFWFPGATGSGIDFGAMLAYQIVSFLDVAVGGDYLRYAFNFGALPDTAGLPEPGGKVPAPYIAGGATDTYISGWVGAILHFDASASSGDGKAAVELSPSGGEE